MPNSEEEMAKPFSSGEAAGDYPRYVFWERDRILAVFEKCEKVGGIFFNLGLIYYRLRPFAKLPSLRNILCICSAASIRRNARRSLESFADLEPRVFVQNVLGYSDKSPR